MSTNKSGRIERKVIILTDDIQPQKKQVKQFAKMIRIMSHNTHIFLLLDFSHDDFVWTLNDGGISCLVISDLHLQLSHQIGDFLLYDSVQLLVEVLMKKTTSLGGIWQFALIIFDPTNRGCHVEAQIVFFPIFKKFERIADVLFIAELQVLSLLINCLGILALRLNQAQLFGSMGISLQFELHVGVGDNH